MSKYQYSFWVSVIALAIPALALASNFNDASIVADTPITVGSMNLTISGTTAIVQSMRVDTGAVTAILKGGSFMTLKSTDRYKFTTNSSPAYVSSECTATYSAVTLRVPAGSSDTITITVYPDSTQTCGAASTNTSTSGGGGGGGGGGAPYIAPSTPAKAPVICPTGLICTPLASKPNVRPSVAGISPVFTRRLTQGSSSDDVRRLQTLLASDPSIYPEGQVTGYFGKLTRKAVENFQVKYKIAAPGDEGFGTVGPLTRASLQKIFNK